MTRAPAPSSCSAKALPRPRLAPVTTSTVRASMNSDSLLETGDNERIEVAVEYLLRIGNFHVRAQVFDTALIQHIRPDLVTPAYVCLGIFQDRKSTRLNSSHVK